MQGFTGVITAIGGLVLGLLLGFLLRHLAGKSERAAAKNERAQFADRTTALATEIAALHAEITQLRELADRRAGFESLCAERQSLIDRLTAERDQVQHDLQLKVESERLLGARISQLETELNNERENLKEKKSLADQFSTIANEILEKKSKTIAEASQKDLDKLLMPLRDQIRDFRKKVEEAQSDSKLGVNTLQTLIGNLNSMNQQLTEEARNLTTALRGSAKTQGDWGEFILRDLLDKAGLREGEQYTFQQSFAAESENGDRARTLRTDVVLLIPGGRHLVIDSKVSLNAYTDYANAASEDGRKIALKAHLTSVRTHIGALARAGYHRLPELEAPDFIVMFIPVEPAFLMALQADSELWADAYRQGILLVGPTTLLYVIRIINVLWQQERQARNVKEVMDRGTELYEKFVGFVTEMDVLGDALRKTDQHYSNAMKKLGQGRGNLIRQVEMLKKLGLRTTKSIPQKLLDGAEVDQTELALSAEAEEGPGAAE